MNTTTVTTPPTNVILRHALMNLNLSTGGNKPELIKRYYDFWETAPSKDCFQILDDEKNEHLGFGLQIPVQGEEFAIGDTNFLSSIFLCLQKLKTSEKAEKIFKEQGLEDAQQNLIAWPKKCSKSISLEDLAVYVEKKEKRNRPTTIEYSSYQKELATEGEEHERQRKKRNINEEVHSLGPGARLIAGDQLLQNSLNNLPSVIYVTPVRNKQAKQTKIQLNMDPHLLEDVNLQYLKYSTTVSKEKFVPDVPWDEKQYNETFKTDGKWNCWTCKDEKKIIKQSGSKNQLVINECILALAYIHKLPPATAAASFDLNLAPYKPFYNDVKKYHSFFINEMTNSQIKDFLRVILAIKLVRARDRVAKKKKRVGVQQTQESDQLMDTEKVGEGESIQIQENVQLTETEIPSDLYDEQQKYLQDWFIKNNCTFDAKFLAQKMVSEGFMVENIQEVDVDDLVFFGYKRKTAKDVLSEITNFLKKS